MFEATGWSLEEEGKDNAKFDMLMPSVVKPPKTCDLILDEGQYPHEVRKILEKRVRSSWPQNRGSLQIFGFHMISCGEL